MSFMRKRSVLSIKDEQSIIVQLEREEKGTNLSAEYGVSSQQIYDIHKNTDCRSFSFGSSLLMFTFSIIRTISSSPNEPG